MFKYTNLISVGPMLVIPNFIQKETNIQGIGVRGQHSFDCLSRSLFKLSIVLWLSNFMQVLGGVHLCNYVS